MKNKLRASFLLSVGLVLTQAVAAEAALFSSYQFNGKGNWSLDAVGGNNSPVGSVSADIPINSIIEKAFLYSSSIPFQSAAPTINFDGTVYQSSDFLGLGVNTTALGLRAWRVDVTSQVASKVAGSGGLFNFLVQSENPNFETDGEALAVVYSNPNEQTRTIAFLDGFSQSSGDSFAVNLAKPIDKTKAGFEALFSLGIGYGFQGTQQDSQVSLDGQRITSAAGGEDDGATENGGLITIGGLGDSPNNPADPFAGANGDPRFDDELYSLIPFLTNGATSFRVDTLNPSNDDNIFFAGINITAVAGVDSPPPDTDPTKVPEPSSLLGMIFVGVAALFGYKKKESTVNV